MFKRNWKKNMGYTLDQKGIMTRYMAESGSWDGHLNHCKTQIIDYLLGQSESNVVIIGSGWLLDVPMDWLLDHKEHIYLIDIHHPFQVKHKYRKNHQVHFIEQDVLGNLSKKIFDLPAKGKIDIVLEEIGNHHLNIDFNSYNANVISLNILNQLDIILLDYLKKVGIEMDLNEELELRKLIQQLHLNSLPKDNALLISDVVQVSLNDQGKKMTEKSLIYASLNSLKELNSWKWNFDTRKTYDLDYQTNMKVKAFKL